MLNVYTKPFESELHYLWFMYFSFAQVSLFEYHLISGCLLTWTLFIVCMWYNKEIQHATVTSPPPDVQLKMIKKKIESGKKFNNPIFVFFCCFFFYLIFENTKK